MSPVVTAPTRGGFNLGDYVEVKDRIAQFYEKHPDGRLVTLSVTASNEPDGKPRVWVEAAAYRTVDDPLPAKGWSWMELPGSTPYTRGSEIENTETSAWGRAIGALGIGIKKSIASKEEVQGKSGEQERIDEGLIGIAAVGKSDADFELRMTPDGNRLAFRLTEGRSGQKVVATGLLAEQVAAHRSEIEGQRVTCFGSITQEGFDKGAQHITYNVVALTRLQVGALTLPEPVVIEEGILGLCGSENAALDTGLCTFLTGHAGAHGNAEGRWPQ